jgi:hypothetical protein
LDDEQRTVEEEADVPSDSAAMVKMRMALWD